MQKALEVDDKSEVKLDFRTAPDRYRHWSISTDGPVATLIMAVDEDSPFAGGYELKLNSYDIGVDLELYDAVQRLRFEHPEVRTVVLTSGIDTMFCAAAYAQSRLGRIRLAGSVLVHGSLAESLRLISSGIGMA